MARVKRARVPNVYDRAALRLEVGDMIKVTKINQTGTWEGELRGKIGQFPFNYIEWCDECSTNTSNNNNGNPGGTQNGDLTSNGPSLSRHSPSSLTPSPTTTTGTGDEVSLPNGVLSSHNSVASSSALSLPSADGGLVSPSQTSLGSSLSYDSNPTTGANNPIVVASAGSSKPGIPNVNPANGLIFPARPSRQSDPTGASEQGQHQSLLHGGSAAMRPPKVSATENSLNKLSIKS